MSGTIDPALPITAAAFTQNYPLFANAAIYPPAMITTYLNLANQMLNFDRWRELFPLGQMLWSAHYLTLDALNAKQAAATGIAGGGVIGNMSSKSVGSVSVSYDVSSGIEAGGGHYNLTLFGREFIRWARMAGMGGVQINGGGVFLANSSALPSIATDLQNNL